jgi:hypothetical protein
MRTKNKIWIATLLIYILLLFMGIYLGSIYVLVCATATFFLLSMFLLTDNSIDRSKKNRPTAMLYSFIPGAAHIYLHQYKRCTVFFTLYAITLMTVIPMTYFYSNLILLSLMIMLLFFNGFLSMVDTEYVCNKLNLPYTGDVYEVRIKNYGYAYIAAVSPLFIPLFGAIYSIFSEGIEKNEETMYIILSLLLIAGLSIWIIKCLKLNNNSSKVCW